MDRFCIKAPGYRFEDSNQTEMECDSEGRRIYHLRKGMRKPYLNQTAESNQERKDHYMDPEKSEESNQLPVLCESIQDLRRQEIYHQELQPGTRCNLRWYIYQCKTAEGYDIHRHLNKWKDEDLIHQTDLCG